MRKGVLLAGLVLAFAAGLVLWFRVEGAPGPGPGGPPGAASPATGDPDARVLAEPQMAPGSPHPDVPSGPNPHAPSDAADPHAGLHGNPVSEMTRRVRAYQVTRKRLEAYATAVKQIRSAGEADPALMARLREPGPPGEGPEAMGVRLERIEPLKRILDRHGLGGIDLVLMPQAVIAGRSAFAIEQEGRTVPPEETNASAMALYRNDLPGMQRITAAFLADLGAIAGP